MIRGIVVKMSSVLPFITLARFKCIGCGETISIDQIDEVLMTPKECTTCGSRRGFTMNYKDSIFIDSQTIIIQESPEDLPPGMLPTQIVISLKADIVEKARPGDIIAVTGVMGLIRKYKKGGISRKFDFVVEANHIEVSSKSGEILDITPVEELEIIELSKDPEIFSILKKCMAPSLFGLKLEKEAALYQLFGGVREERPDVTIRGDISILLLGDPGVGKTQLLQFIVLTAPRGILTTGRGSTAVGLTAAVVKDERIGGFTLEAGALVLGDLGHVAIDELDKMRDDDRDAMHTVMEQQIVPIAKGGIVATLNARTSIIASANPTLGRWNPYQTIAANISNFPITLLNRFDLIFILRDIPNTEKDKKMAQYALSLVDGDPALYEPPIPHSLFRKYIAYARANVKPKLTEAVRDSIQNFYSKMRAASLEGGEAAAISISMRQLESTVRIAKARAKIHLRHEVTDEDAKYAIQIMTRSLEQVGLDPKTGKIDLDIMFTGRPRSLQMQLQAVLAVIGEMERIDGDVRDDDLFEAMSSDHGMRRTDVARFIAALMTDGTIYAPRPGYYKRTM